MFKVSEPDRTWGIKIPQLDDITFDELVEEAKKMIPQYAPQWTDYNLHDPGITIIELLSWIVETQIFRLDQITEKETTRFLHLLGQDPQKNEKLKDAKMRAQVDLKKLYKAVTLDDFEQLAKETPGVSIARAKAFWNKDRVQVVIVPDIQQTNKKQRKPLTTEEIKRRVYLRLDKRRILTTIIELVDPKYFPVSVHVEIKTKLKASAEGVIQRVDNMLKDFFSPETWPFGRNIYASEVIAKIENIDGVDLVLDLVLSAGNDSSRKLLELSRNCLAQSGKHQIRIVGS
jgi:hypothetical protein